MEFENNELIIALTFAVGTPEEKVIARLRSILESDFRYAVTETKITEFIKNESTGKPKETSAYSKILYLMDQGDSIREAKSNDWFAYKCMERISKVRQPYVERRAHIITSLKRPEEIRFLRKIYGDSLFVFGLMSEESFRKNQLIERGMSRYEAEKLLDRDYDDKKEFGQCFKDTFPLSDFFLKITETSDDTQTIKRAVNLIVSAPASHG
ncbi:MAG TPA: hypothetical protein VE954_32370 [Oligoflexus sp.]|uniref:hypothetical protein n=1 Tax=Oligoflexus sp. TaxID=1971216 RepID=UPI002D280309|nr:hypothetical protein [Oligoflexus sp.]HYX37823.1 hypothetical protein [Oligoflexus sp.]